MKTSAVVTTILVFLMFSASVFAVENHVEKGKYIVGAGTALSYTYNTVDSTIDGEKSTIESDSVQLEALFGYFIFNGLEIGPLGSVRQTNKYTDSDLGSLTEKELGYGAGAQIGYWLFTNSNFYPYVKLEIKYTIGSSSYKYKYEDSDTSSNNWDYTGTAYGPSGGLSYFVTKEAALNFGLSYEIQKQSGTYKTKYGNDEDTLDEKQNQTAIAFEVGIGLFF